MKLNIIQKLLLVATLPIITLLIFSTNHIVDKYSLVSSSKNELLKLSIIEITSDLIHELQIERGISASYLNKVDSDYFSSIILPQRVKTDEVLQKFKSAIVLLNNKSISLSSKKYIHDTLPMLKKISNIRKTILDKSIQAELSFAYFTKLDNLLISILNGFKVHANTANTNMFIMTLRQMIDLQEFAGQERALIAQLVYTKSITQLDMRHFESLHASQMNSYKNINFILENSTFEHDLQNIHKLYINSYYHNIITQLEKNEERREEFDQKVLELFVTTSRNEDSTEIVKFYKKILSHELQIDSKKWFEVSTQRINKFHNIEKQLLENIYTNIDIYIKELNTSLVIQILLTIITIIILLLGTFSVANKIKYSISQLNQGINEFFDFLNFKIDKPKNINTNSHDEISDMAEYINREMSFIEEKLQEDKDFIHEATQVVMMMKDGDFSERPYFEPNNPHLIDLKDVLNELIELISQKIKEQTTSLERLNSSLEDRVYHQTVELEKQIQEITISRDKAVQAEIAKDEFLSNMSHEIRTPLNAILGFVSILKKRVSEEKSLNYLNIIDTSGKSLLTIINDILDFSKIQSGKFTITLGEIEPIKEFSDAVLLFASKAYEKHLVYTVYIDPKMPKSINIDTVRVKQILSNILSNAIKFTPQDGEVHVSVSLKESELVISVKDNGIGIAKENISKVFSAFEQADGSTTRKYGGTGLGLSISSRLATLMNGELKVESTLNHGSIFTLSIPIQTLDRENLLLLNSPELSKYRYAILSPKADNPKVTLIKQYMKDFGLGDILELHSYQKDGYDLLFFIPDDAYNEEIVMSEVKAIAILRSQSIKLANLEHIQPLYAPLVPQYIVDSIKNSNLQIQKTLIQTENKIKNSSDDIKFNGSILVAEDNKTNQMLISLILDDYELEYTIVNNGLEAVDMFKKQNFDLVLMDENMPELNGIGAMKIIKEYEKENQLTMTPIIALTASVLEKDKEMFINAGMDGFVGKPINTDELEKVLGSFLTS